MHDYRLVISMHSLLSSATCISITSLVAFHTDSSIVRLLSHSSAESFHPDTPLDAFRPHMSLVAVFQSTFVDSFLIGTSSREFLTANRYVHFLQTHHTDTHMHVYSCILSSTLIGANLTDAC